MKDNKYFKLIIIGVLVFLGIIYFKNKNQYYDLAQITKLDLNDIYLMGRNLEHNEALNYLYGAHYKASTLSDGSTANTLLIYYDKNGKEILKLDFLGNRDQVTINGEKYLYKTTDSKKYSFKELYPNSNKNNSEKLLNGIVKQYNTDKHYMWEYFDGYSSSVIHPQSYNSGVRFLNEGVEVTILEYNDNTIDDDYKKECRRIEEEYMGYIDNSYKDDTKEITYMATTTFSADYMEDYLPRGNVELKYNVIKYANLIITVGYYYDKEQEQSEMNKNIEILNNYLIGKSIL